MKNKVGYIVCPHCSENIRLNSFRAGKSMNDPGEVFQSFQFLLPLDHEEFWIAMLDCKSKIIGRHKVSEGSLAAALVHPRDVFAPAVTQSAFSVILVHNHPSGDATPSGEDAALTRRLVQAGDVLGIRVLDHVIVATEGFYSFADAGGLR